MWRPLILKAARPRSIMKALFPKRASSNIREDLSGSAPDPEVHHKLFQYTFASSN